MAGSAGRCGAAANCSSAALRPRRRASTRANGMHARPMPSAGALELVGKRRFGGEILRRRRWPRCPRASPPRPCSRRRSAAADASARAMAENAPAFSSSASRRAERSPFPRRPRDGQQAPAAGREDARTSSAAPPPSRVDFRRSSIGPSGKPRSAGSGRTASTPQRVPGRPAPPATARCRSTRRAPGRSAECPCRRRRAAPTSLSHSCGSVSE